MFCSSKSKTGSFLLLDKTSRTLFLSSSSSPSLSFPTILPITLSSLHQRHRAVVVSNSVGVVAVGRRRPSHRRLAFRSESRAAPRSRRRLRSRLRPRLLHRHPRRPRGMLPIVRRWRRKKRRWEGARMEGPPVSMIKVENRFSGEGMAAVFVRK